MTFLLLFIFISIPPSCNCLMMKEVSQNDAVGKEDISTNSDPCQDPLARAPFGSPEGGVDHRERLELRLDHTALNHIVTTSD
jgi:hypothetical protein